MSAAGDHGIARGHSRAREIRTRGALGARLGHTVGGVRRATSVVADGVVLRDKVGWRSRAEGRTGGGQDESRTRGTAVARRLEQVHRAVEVDIHTSVKVGFARSAHHGAKMEDRDRTSCTGEERLAIPGIRHVADCEFCGLVAVQMGGFCVSCIA